MTDAIMTAPGMTDAIMTDAIMTDDRTGGCVPAVTLHLHGTLATYGPRLRFRLDRPQAVIAAAAAQCPAFERALRRGRFTLAVGSARRPLAGDRLDRPLAEMRELHLSPVRAGRGRGEGKMLLGLTLLGLSFVPGVQSGLAGGLSGIGEGIAGAGGAELGGLLGSRLLGGAGAWLMLSGASEALAPQARRPAGAPSTAVAPQTPTGEGAAIPLVYGTARVEAPPVVSAGLSVKAMQP